MERWLPIPFFNNCERNIERQITTKCLPGFSRVLKDTLHEGEKRRAWKTDETEDGIETVHLRLGLEPMCWDSNPA